jgi:Fe-S oxidoreductase
MGIKELLGLNKPLLHNGCLLGKHHDKELSDDYQLLLSELGISFITDSDYSKKTGLPFICGGLALELGFEKDFIKIARKNTNNLRNAGIDRIIVTCPQCFKTLSVDYKEFILDWSVRVDFVLDLVLKKISGRRLSRDIGFDLTYHDSSYLGRGMGIYDTPRKIIKLLGHTLIEMQQTRNHSIDSGSSGGLPITNPSLADSIAGLRVSHVPKSARALVVVGMRDYSHFKKNCPPNLLVLDVCQLVLNGLGIKKLEVVL